MSGLALVACGAAICAGSSEVGLKVLVTGKSRAIFV